MIALAWRRWYREEASFQREYHLVVSAAGPRHTPNNHSTIRTIVEQIQVLTMDVRLLKNSRSRSLLDQIYRRSAFRLQDDGRSKDRRTSRYSGTQKKNAGSVSRRDCMIESGVCLWYGGPGGKVAAMYPVEHCAKHLLSIHELSG